MKRLYRKTKRLIIRPLETGDYVVWAKAHLETTQRKLNRFDLRPRIEEELTKKTYRKVLKDQREMRSKDKYYHLGIFLKNGEYLGTVSLMDISRQLFQNGYLGYRILNQYWGKGYGKEAVVAAIDVAFKDLKLHRIEAGIEPGNRRSIRLAKSVGLRKEGHSKRRLYLNNKWIDLLLFAATSEEYGIDWKLEK